MTLNILKGILNVIGNNEWRDSNNITLYNVMTVNLIKKAFNIEVIDGFNRFFSVHYVYEMNLFIRFRIMKSLFYK